MNNKGREKLYEELSEGKKIRYSLGVLHLNQIGIRTLLEILISVAFLWAILISLSLLQYTKIMVVLAIIIYVLIIPIMIIVKSRKRRNELERGMDNSLIKWTRKKKH